MEFIYLKHHPVELNPKIMLNSASNLYKSEWLDLVFKNRNQSYGAYLLRSESASITLKAFFIVAPLFVLLFAGPLVYQRLHPQVHVVQVEMDPVTIVEPPVKEIVPQKKLEAPKAEPFKEKLNTVKLTSKITVTEHPVIDENPPLVDELKNAVVGQVTQVGAATNASAAPEVNTGNGGTGTAIVADNTVYDTSGIDKYPEFEGGMAAWAKFIQRNLRYPAAAQEQDIQGKVFISFVIEKDGSISDVNILKGIGGGCDQEAMRVIKKSPKWKAGQQQNNPVRVRYTIPISFMLGN